MNGEMEVFSFVSPNPLNSWDGDIQEFWALLASEQGYPADSQYLISTSCLTLSINSVDKYPC